MLASFSVEVMVACASMAKYGRRCDRREAKPDGGIDGPELPWMPPRTSRRCGWGNDVEHHAEVLHGRIWWTRQASWHDAVVIGLVLTSLVLLGAGLRQMAAPFDIGHPVPISLAPEHLPRYALRSTLRMLAALAASLVFTFTYATWAAKSRHAGKVLIPLLDVLQSVPILGYLSMTTVFFLALFPHRILGAELAAIFAIFTSQAWNMAFSFYQALRTVPPDLDEASRAFRHSRWQRFWRLELPFAMPGLLWNTMMSMSGGWFFVVASEAIAVGTLHIDLPGIGSYVALAIEKRDLAAIGWAIAAMLITILVYDQLLFRPLVAWAEKFRVEQTAAQIVPASWLLDLLRASTLVAYATAPVAAAAARIARFRWQTPAPIRQWRIHRVPAWVASAAWTGAVALALLAASIELIDYAAASISWGDVADLGRAGGLTFVRVTVLIVLASLVWVPVGVTIGLRPRLAEKVQPIAQFLAAFPANLLFPLAVFLILRYQLDAAIWLSPLMILGTQWYILFNVIAGASAFPSDLREAAMSFRVRGRRWWRLVILPGIFPYYVTGAITASGGAWNASIVAETVNWGHTTLTAGGLGAYIARATAAGDYPRITLGIAVMSLLVVATNRLLWRPLYRLAERRTRLD
ncbi:MAG TPA: ABC transporter permease subunit [Telluria sp.]